MPLTFSGGSFQCTQGSGVGFPRSSIKVEWIDQGAFCMWARVNDLGSSPANLFMCNAVGNAPPSFMAKSNQQWQVAVRVSGANQVVGLGNYSSGNAAHLAVSWNQNNSPAQLVYINGNLVASGHFPGFIQGPGQLSNNPFSIGINSDSVPGTGRSFIEQSFTIQDFCVYSGYTPTVNDFQDLSLRNKRPMDIGPSGALVWLTCDGPSGVSATANPVGVRNSGFGGSFHDFLATTVPFAGVWPTGVAVYDNSSLTFTPPLFISDSYLSKHSGMIFFFISSISTNNYSIGNTIIVNPTITVKDGPVNYTLQLSSGNTDSTLPWIMYVLPSSITNNATITYSVPDAWIDNGADIAGPETGYIRNLAGHDPLPYPSSNLFKIGMNLTAALADPQYNCSPIMNYALRSNGIGNGQKTEDFRPLNTNGGAGQFINMIAAINSPIDGSNYGFPTGEWYISYTDSPTNSSLYEIQNFQNVIQSKRIVQTITSGVCFTEIMPVVKASSGANGLYMQFFPKNTGSVNINHLKIIAPGNPRDVDDNLAMDRTFYDFLVTSGNKGCPILRFMDNMVINNCNMVTEEHFLPATGFNWKRSDTKLTTSGMFRPYSLAVTPSAYLDWYGWYTPTQQNWFFNYNNNARLEFEWVGNVPHGLHTGQLTQISFSPQVKFDTVGNGNSTLGLSYSGANVLVIVTSPSSFIAHTFIPGNTGTGTATSTISATYTGITLNLQYSRYQNAPPWEAIIAYTSGIKNCDMHLNVPHGATNGFVTKLAQKCLAGLPPSRHVKVEYTNEHWNTIFQSFEFMPHIANVLGQANPNAGYAVRASQIHDIFDAVFTSGGRPGKIIRAFGGQFAFNLATNNIINAVIANNLKIDTMVTAPYLDTPNTSNWTAIVRNLPMAMFHDFYRHYHWYSTSTVNQFAGNVTSRNSYFNRTGSGYYDSTYEMATQLVIPGNFPSGFNRSLDFFYHPENYYTNQFLNKICQQYGFVDGCYYTLSHPSFFNAGHPPEFQWYTIRYIGQPVGKGDGSDGGTVNKMASSDGFSHDNFNVSVAQQGWKDYIDSNPLVSSTSNDTSGAPSNVVSTTPAGNATNVPVNTLINATFGNDVPNNSLVWTVKDAANHTVTGTLIYNNSLVTYSHSGNLSFNTVYNSVLSGTNTAPFSWSWTTAPNSPTPTPTPSPTPTVISTTPSPNDVNVPVDTTINVIFSTGVPVDSLTWTVQDSSDTIVPATLIYNDSTVVYSNNNPLESGTSYNSNLSGSGINPFSWSWTTLAPTPSPTPTPTPSPTPTPDNGGGHLFIPASSNPLNFLNGGVVLAVGLLQVAPTDRKITALNYPYMGIPNQYNENKANVIDSPNGPGVTQAIVGGTFSAMSKGRYIILTFNDRIAGTNNRVLRSPSRYNTKSQNNNIGWINTRQINRNGGWYYVNGMPVAITYSRDSIRTENPGSYRIPGRITFLSTGKITRTISYHSKND